MSPDSPSDERVEAFCSGWSKLRLTSPTYFVSPLLPCSSTSSRLLPWPRLLRRLLYGLLLCLRSELREPARVIGPGVPDIDPRDRAEAVRQLLVRQSKYKSRRSSGR